MFNVEYKKDPTKYLCRRFYNEKILRTDFRKQEEKAF